MTPPAAQAGAAARDSDVACFGYLAHAQVVHVDTYPDADHGAVVRRVTASIAGDAAIVATLCAQRGRATRLIANPVGLDPNGRQVSALLACAGVEHHRAVETQEASPALTVITDDTGTRTWFARLDSALTGLAQISLTAMTSAHLAYIDAYTVLAPHAARAVLAARGTPVLLNLGGDPLHPAVEAACQGRHLAAVQTSLAHREAGRAADLATDLHTRLGPDTTIVTLGALGALAITPAGIHHTPAVPVVRPCTHGAGAALSAGYLHALMQGCDVQSALDRACATASAACATTADGPRLLDDMTALTI